MNLQEKWPKGQRVRPRPNNGAVSCQPDMKGRPALFTVIGYSRTPDCVRILRDGASYSNSVHVDFLEKIL